MTGKTKQWGGGGRGVMTGYFATGIYLQKWTSIMLQERLQFTACYVALDSESEQLSAFISKINFNP